MRAEAFSENSLSDWSDSYSLRFMTHVFHSGTDFAQHSLQMLLIAILVQPSVYPEHLEIRQGPVRGCQLFREVTSQFLRWPPSVWAIHAFCSPEEPTYNGSVSVHLATCRCGIRAFWAQHILHNLKLFDFPPIPGDWAATVRTTLNTLECGNCSPDLSDLFFGTIAHGAYTPGLTPPALLNSASCSGCTMVQSFA